MSSRSWLAGIALVGLLAVGIALVSQHRFGMEPCPWCVLQRLVFVAIAAVALLALAWKPLAIGVIALAAGGVAAALWQHFVAAASASCNLTWADRFLMALQLPQTLPDVFEPRASCAEAKVALLGVPYEFWSLALFVLLGVAAVRALRSRA